MSCASESEVEHTRAMVSCMHTERYHMHADSCLVCLRDKPRSTVTAASHFPPADPREPHGLLLFHCSPLAGASR